MAEHVPPFVHRQDGHTLLQFALHTVQSRMDPARPDALTLGYTRLMMGFLLSLPSPARIRAAAQEAGLRVVQEFAFGRDYAETLRRWHQRFAQQRARVQAQGFDARFQRTWEFYLAYCEAGFDARSIDVVQYTLIKD